MSETCRACGASIPDWDGAYWARNMLCLACFERKQDEERHQPCGKCGARLRPDQLTLHAGLRLCKWCLQDAQRREREHTCAFCGKWIEDPRGAQRLEDGRPVCAVCIEKNAQAMGGMRCYTCGRRGKYPYFAPDGKIYCEDCAQKERRGKTGGISYRPLFARALDGLKHALGE